MDLDKEGKEYFMRIIDEKGRLFGKINIIDFLVILFLLSLTPMLYFGYKISNKKAPEVIVQVQQQKLREEFMIMINCYFIKLKPEALKMISVGDKEWDSDGNLIGEIISLGELLPYVYKFDVGPNKKLIRKDPELQQIAVTLKINAAVRDKNIYYKDKQILEGGMLEFSSAKYSVEIKDITIIKDNYNVVIDNIVENASVEEKKLDAFKKEFSQQLSSLESRVEQLTNEINLSKPNNKTSKKR